MTQKLFDNPELFKGMGTMSENIWNFIVGHLSNDCYFYEEIEFHVFFLSFFRYRKDSRIPAFG